MGNIGAHVFIDGGTIVSSPIAAEIGLFQYFVNVVEEDGCEIGMWSGSSYQQAIIEAEIIAEEWGELPVHDRIGRTGPLQ